MWLVCINLSIYIYFCFIFGAGKQFSKLQMIETHTQSHTLFFLVESKHIVEHMGNTGQGSSSVS